MTLLEFARGPGLQWSLVILTVGMLWRLVGILALKHKPDFAEPRARGAAVVYGAVKTLFTRMVYAKPFRTQTTLPSALSYVFHIGLAIVVFGFGPHILFIRDLTGLSWPNLPSGMIYLTGVITLGALVAVLVRRMTHPVLRLLSNFDDYFSWLVTVLPIATGLLAVAHLGARYETLLALHILSVELLFVWLPFGKLGHAFLVFVSRATTGALFARRGAAT